MSNEVFKIDAQEDTPSAVLEKKGSDNSIAIKGVSMPENALEYFDPLSEKIFSFFESSFANMTMEIGLEYMNSMSNKQLLKLIKNISEKAPDLKIIWKYSKTDDLIKIKGEEIQTIFPNINIVLEENSMAVS
jgi:hypothetical protein